ncbi:MAG: helix-turn-helix domain-containing protein [Flammeovirgaceae bacterium]
MQLKRFLFQNQIDRAIFAKKIGVSVPALHRYLHGERFPRIEHLKAIAIATEGKVLPNDFLDLDITKLSKGRK